MAYNIHGKGFVSLIIPTILICTITVTPLVTRQNISSNKWESFLKNYRYRGINYTSALANITGAFKNQFNVSEQQQGNYSALVPIWLNIFKKTMGGFKMTRKIVNELRCNGSRHRVPSRFTNASKYGIQITLEAPLDYLWGIQKAKEYNEYSNLTDYQNFYIKSLGRIYILTGKSFDGKLVLLCKAGFPIRWALFGHSSMPSKTEIHLSLRYMKKDGNWFYSSYFAHNIVELQRHRKLVFQKVKSAGLYSSVTITCHHHSNPSINESIDVFFEGSHVFVENELRSIKDIAVKNSNVIPCVTTNPTKTISLYRTNNGSKHEVPKSTGYRFNPRVGFIFPNPVKGNFTCEFKNEFVSFSVGTIQDSGYKYEPKMKGIYALIKDKIRLSCSYIGPKNLTLFFLQDDIFSVAENEGFITTASRNESTNISWEMVGLDFRAVGFTGNVSCVENSGKVISSWQIKLRDPPKLLLDNFERTMTCLQGFVDTGMKLRAIECINPADCIGIKNCLVSGQNSCTTGRKFQEGNLTTFTYFGYSTKIPYLQQNSIAECSTPGGEYVRRWILYVTLDNLKKGYYAQVEERELLRMDQVPSVLHANGTSEFVCQAVLFMFVGQLLLQVEYQNGTRSWIEFFAKFGPDCMSRWNSSLRVHTSFDGVLKRHPRRIYGINTLAHLNLSLTTDIVAVRCLATWWNSSDFLVTEQRFRTLYQLPPTSNIPKGNLKMVLTRGGPTQKLNCSVTAEPAADYLWFRDGNVVESSSDIVITSGKQFESLLEFATVRNDLKGEWLCMATNEFGFLNTTFTIDDVIERADNSVTMIVVIISLLLLFALLCVYLIKRLRLKQTNRNLTEQELNAFFEGMPGLARKQLDDPENIELFPYNKDFEIDVKDLEFESMKILGTGAYGTVVQGRRRSTNTDVAVKIAKASSNIEIFKSLLVEVKIMIYMGKHENLVAFIGACTSNIRTGRIHIVLEICERGDLTSILRNCKQSFINLVDENQDVNAHLIPLTEKDGDPKRISTLDLLRWSAEIGHGMEYLAFKGIVHADLATRNILIKKDWTAKVSDFGLSRKLYENINYVKKTRCPLPWRWMSPEALKALTFSIKSDVWSYGITIWELFTLGDTPFANESWNKEFTARLINGMLPGKPKFANAQIYYQMIACWENDPNLRPEFSTLRKYFMELFGKENRIASNRDKTLYQNAEKILYMNCELNFVENPVYENLKH